MNERLTAFFVCLAVLGCAVLPAAAALPTQWIRPPASPGSWFDGGNWSAGVPNNTYDAFVYEGIVQVQAAGAGYSMLRVGINPGFQDADLAVTGGGQLSGLAGILGENAGSKGAATVDGAGAAWTNTDGVLVGGYGTGTLGIANGGSVVGNVGIMGQYAGSDGTVTVDGAGSSWGDNADMFMVGMEGKATLDITGGGGVTSGGAAIGSVGIGYFPGSAGTVTVNGPGSTWTVTSSMIVGMEGVAKLNIGNGGVVTSGGVPAEGSGVGVALGGQGTVTVDGAGSSWTTGDLVVGSQGTGAVKVVNGGGVIGGGGGLGFSGLGFGPGGTGMMTVDGPGSYWTTTEVMVGASGLGTMTISNGGTVTGGAGSMGFSALGFESDGKGMMTVDGPGSSWTSTDLVVGMSGLGTMKIANGGTVTGGGGGMGHSTLGYTIDGEGTVTVHGAGSSWNTTDLMVGREGTGMLTIANGGSVSNSGGAGFAVVGHLSGGKGTVAVDGAGSSWTVAAGYIGVGAGGTGKLDITNAALVQADQLIVGSAGTVTLNGGRLVVFGVENDAGGTFNFLGGRLNATSFMGTLVNQGGELGPGLSPGILTVTGGYTQSAGTLLIEIGGTNAGTEYDRLNCMGALMLGGTLEVELIGGFVPSVGELFDVLDWGTRSGTFAAVLLPPLPPDRTWDTSDLYTTGEIGVVVPEPGTLAVLLLAGPLLLRRRRKTNRR